MKLLAVNGSPRKKWNTAQLLTQVVEGAREAGAEAELVHLVDLKYTGCKSCFACKKIGGLSYGRCVLKDELRPVLDRAHEADVLVLGTPFYICAESAFMRAFEERLWFQYLLRARGGHARLRQGQDRGQGQGTDGAAVRALRGFFVLRHPAIR